LPIDPSTAFVSYSREDLEFVLRLAKDLKAKGAKVWMDKLDIRPGQRWEAEVETALDGCLRMLVILSPASIASKNVLAEAGFAIDEGKEVIPVLHRDCKVPFRLRPLQYADFRSGYGSGLDELFVTLSGGQEAAAAEQERLEKERDATEQARLTPKGLEGKEAEEKDEEARLEQLHREDREVAEKAQQTELERRKFTAETVRSDHDLQAVPDFSAAAPALLSTRAKLGIAAGVIVLGGLLVYWAFVPSAKPTTENKPPDVAATQSQQGVQPNDTNASLGGTQIPETRNESKSPSVSLQSSPKSKLSSPAGSEPSSPIRSHQTLAITSPNSTTAESQLPSGLSTEVANAYRKAQAGDSNAMVTVGYAYHTGSGAPQDYGQAISWFRKSAAAGNDEGMRLVGQYYELGFGVRADVNEAIVWYRKAAKLGNETAKSYLARLGVTP
jgi:hypothetical protein